MSEPNDVGLIEEIRQRTYLYFGQVGEVCHILGTATHAWHEGERYDFPVLKNLAVGYALDAMYQWSLRQSEFLEFLSDRIGKLGLDPKDVFAAWFLGAEMAKQEQG